MEEYLKNIKFGALPSPKDTRDFPISRLVAPVNVFPDEFILPYNHEIKNQNEIGSCVAHSLAYCREITEEKQSNKYKKFSPGFVYANRENTDWQESGMYPREALKSLQNYGIVEYNKFPYNEEYPGIKNKLNPIKEQLLKDAEPYKITSYCRLYNENNIKNALMQLGAVTICAPIYQSFYNIKNDGITPIPKKNETLYGYHEMTIIGWRKDKTWINLNSWSSFWGNNGKCYIPFNFPIAECWSITDNILPHPEPEPEKQKYWRCQMAAFKNKNSCEALKEKILKETGFKGYIVFVDGLYKLQLNAFVSEENCRNFSKQLKSMGYNNFIIFY